MSTHNIYFMIKYENCLKISINNSLAIKRISKRLKNEFKLAMVNKPTVFELLRFYCTS